MSTTYDFRNLSGLAPVTWTNDLHFIATGMKWDYDLRRMSTGDNRRDFGPGISGNQFSAKVETSYTELKLYPPYPDDSYHFTLQGRLRLLDLRNVPDPMFSGQYYDADRAQSCEILRENLGYLHDHGYDGIIRYSKPELEVDRFETVVAVTPEVIGKISVKQVEPLGCCSCELNVINPDGSKVPMRDFFAKVAFGAGGVQVLEARPGAFYYFAYGSNLKLSEMQRSCPTAEQKFRAKLPDYALVFPRKSKGRQCGVAGIEDRACSEVWGGVYEISEAERVNLESREGFKRNRPMAANSYVPTDLTVFVDGDPTRPVQVMTFLANPQTNPPLPNEDYKGLIIAGAGEWNLAAGYVAQLEQIVTAKS